MYTSESKGFSNPPELDGQLRDLQVPLDSTSTETVPSTLSAAETPAPETGVKPEPLNSAETGEPTVADKMVPTEQSNEVRTPEVDTKDTELITKLERATTHEEISDVKKEALKLGMLESVAITNPKSGKIEWRVIPKGEEGTAITAVAKDASARVRETELAARAVKAEAQVVNIVTPPKSEQEVNDDNTKGAVEVPAATSEKLPSSQSGAAFNEEKPVEVLDEVVPAVPESPPDAPLPIEPPIKIVSEPYAPAADNQVPEASEQNDVSDKPSTPSASVDNIGTSPDTEEPNAGVEARPAEAVIPSEADPKTDLPEPTAEPEPGLAVDKAHVEALLEDALNAENPEIFERAGERLGLLEVKDGVYTAKTPEGERLASVLQSRRIEISKIGQQNAETGENGGKEPKVTKVRGSVDIPGAYLPETKPKGKLPAKITKSNAEGKLEAAKPIEPVAEARAKQQEAAARAEEHRKAMEQEAAARAEERQKAMEQAAASAQTELMTERLLGKFKELDPSFIISGVGPNGEPLTIDDRLSTAREALAMLQAKERHGLIFRHVDKTQFEALDASYRDLIKQRIVEKIKVEIAEGKPERDIRLGAIDVLTVEAHKMSEAEIAAAEKRPGARLQKFLQGHKKTRIAIGLTLAAVGVVSTAAGIMPLAGAALGARALLSGATTYYGAKRALNVSGALGSRKVGSRKRLDDESYDALLRTSYYQQISGLLSSDTLNTEATQKMKTGDQAELVRLEEAERVRLDWKLDRESNLKGKSVAEIMMSTVAERRDADVEQLEKDRRGNIKRSIGALMIAGAASALTLHVGLEHLAGARPQLGHVIKPHGSSKGIRHAAAKIAGAGLEQGPEHFASVHQVVPGESIWKISHNYLLRYDSGWSKLSPQEQLIKTDRLKDIILKQQHAKSLLLPGQQLKMPWAAVSDAIKYKQ